MFVDADFYRQHYAALLEGTDPARHYDDDGRTRGLMPNPEFDPLVAAIRFPALDEAAAAKALAAEGLEAHMQALARDVLAHIEAADAFHWRFSDTQVEKDHFRRPASTIADWDKLDAEGTIPFAAQEKSYSVRKRSPEQVRDLIASGTPCLQPRLPHGFVDLMGQVASVRPIVRGLWGAALNTDEKIERFSIRIVRVLHPKSPVFTENFTQEILQILAASRSSFPICLAFKAHPDSPDRLFGTSDPSPIRYEAAMDVVARHFPDGYEFEDGIAWKRYAATGRIASLIDAMRNRRVVLIANGGFSALGERWGLTDFHHLEIPPAASHLIRHRLLDEISAAFEALDVGKDDRLPAIVLTQAGGSLSLWLLYELWRRFPHASYFDVGQAINIWFMDDPGAAKPEMLWLQDFWERILDANELFAFYDPLVPGGDSRSFFRETYFNGDYLRKLPGHGGDCDFAARLLRFDLPDRALVFAERAHARTPDAIQPIVLLTRLYRRFGRLEEALAMAQTGIGLAPDHRQLRQIHAQLLFDLGDDESYLRAVAAIDLPSGELPLLQMSTAHERQGRYAEALDLLQRRIALQGDEPRVRKRIRKLEALMKARAGN